MTDEQKKQQPDDDDSGRLHIKVLGNEADIPEHMSRGITENIARWIIPAIAILIVFWGLGNMVKSVLEAWNK